MDRQLEDHMKAQEERARLEEAALDLLEAVKLAEMFLLAELGGPRVLQPVEKSAIETMIKVMEFAIAKATVKS